jgi:alpha-galactosidase
LRLLADRAHERGMKFGLWVEPGRVSLDTVGQEGLALEEWLAQSGGRNVSDTSATICFAGRAGWSWVRARLFALLDDVQPDYLKWDNNAWVNCNRAGHDHGADDGNLRQVQGLYLLLRELRERYPSLLIENVAGGGSRLDFEMLRHTDVAWVDDRTSPAIRVRHNLQGVSGLFPPGYLLSFVLDSPAAPLSDAVDPLTEIRSSMIGALGFGYRSTALRPWLADAVRDSIAAYAQVRDILHEADAMLLSEQAPAPDKAAWDVVETLNATTTEAVLFVFHQPGANDRVTVRPRGLEAEANYRVQSLDAGDLGVVSGRVLMEDGVDIVQGPGTQSHVLVIRRAP